MPEPAPLAIVTGAGAGIGRAIVRLLASENFPVAPLEIDPERVESLKQEFPNSPVLTCDVADPAQVEQAVQSLLDQNRIPTACVNNAGIIHRSPLLKTPPETFHRVVDVNLGGCYHFTHVLANLWVERKIEGHIVNISSGHAMIGGYDRVAYAASKAAIESLTRNSAVELGQYGILVNAVAPGFTFTEMSRQSLVGEKLAMVNHRLPIRRVAEAEEVARAVHSLLTGRIPYMTGQTLRIDGGWSSSDLDYSRLKPEPTEN